MVTNIKTAEELRTENQEGKTELVENISENYDFSKAFNVLKYDDKYFIGFMGHMVTEPTEDLEKIIDILESLDTKTWDFILNLMTVLVKNREVLDNLNNKEHE